MCMDSVEVFGFFFKERTMNERFSQLLVEHENQTLQRAKSTKLSVIEDSNLTYINIPTCTVVLK